MRVALGLKSHSGWAALVALGSARGVVRVLDRRRIELVEDAAHEWAGQPYHAADGMPPAQAEDVVARGIAAAQRRAAEELAAARERLEHDGHSLAACAVLAPAPLPPWTTAQILAVHLRMHQAEGALYPAALLHAAQLHGIAARRVAAKTLREDAVRALGISAVEIERRLAALGKPLGAPWAADQKSAALAAMLVLDTGN
jgi:hypothetical protein